MSVKTTKSTLHVRTVGTGELEITFDGVEMDIAGGPFIRGRYHRVGLLKLNREQVAAIREFLSGCLSDGDGAAP